jgi:riboflavin kinase/FMN adenylyltransferase
MQLIQNLNEIRLTQPTILTIGTFDGIHRGHQTLIRQLKAAARQRQALSAVLSFHPRPKTVLLPHLLHDDHLTTADERIMLFEQLDIDMLLLIPFTLELSQTTALDFMQMLKDRLNLIELWAGYDFALGKARQGNLTQLQNLGQQLGYTVHEIEPILIDGQIISSTFIRQLYREGKIEQATNLLGRYPSLKGQVEHGAQRGRTIGFPTVNLTVLPEKLLPANGVYATLIRRLANGRVYRSVTNVGIRPSFGEQIKTIETHIFDFDEDVYGEQFVLEFVERLRPERKFDNVELLIKQIQQDAEQARAKLVDFSH